MTEFKCIIQYCVPPPKEVKHLAPREYKDIAIFTFHAISKTIADRIACQIKDTISADMQSLPLIDISDEELDGFNFCYILEAIHDTIIPVQ